MDPKSEKPLRLFVNPFTTWNELALKTGQAIWASAHAAIVQSNPAAKVAVIPTADAPAPNAQEAAPTAPRHTRAPQPKRKSKANAKRRTKRRAKR